MFIISLPSTNKYFHNKGFTSANSSTYQATTPPLPPSPLPMSSSPLRRTKTREWESTCPMSYHSTGRDVMGFYGLENGRLIKVNTRKDSLASANQFLTHLYALESLTLVLFNQHVALFQQFNISTENKTKVEFSTEHKDKSRMGYKNRSISNINPKSFDLCVDQNKTQQQS